MNDPRTTSRKTPGGGASARALLATALLAASGLAAVAQEIPAPPAMIPLPPPPLAGGDLDDDATALEAQPLADAASSPPVLSGTGTASIIEIKVGQGRFLTLAEDLAQPDKPAPFLAVGDPMVADFFQMGPRQIRLMGKRLGITDLMITTSSGRTFEYELRVVPDLSALGAELRRLFPDATLSLSQLRDKVVVEGQARDTSQVARIVSAIDGYIRNTQRVMIAGQVRDALNAIEQAEGAEAMDSNAPAGPPQGLAADDRLTPGGFAGNLAGLGPVGGMGAMGGQGPGGMGGGGLAPPTTPGSFTANQIATNQTQVINLIRVPTSQQVLLKVRVAELNRTAFRQIGADFLAAIPEFATLFGTQIGGSSYAPGQIGRTTFNPGAPPDPRNIAMGAASTVFGTFSGARFNTVIAALRRNNMLKILAEPNLVTLNGHQADFLAGGQFPVPINSGVGSGIGGNIQVQFKDFGVRLAFLPFVEDGETIRLTVDPEVSSIDFALGATLVPGGTPVPGLNIRRSHTTVELKQGETLAIAGLMQLAIDGQTDRIPGLGDLPYIGAFFSNTTSNRIEKELVVLVTPYLIEPMRPGQVPPTPGDEVDQPNDLEFFLMNRIEGRTGVDARATTMYDDPLHLVRPALIERKYLSGPVGYSK